MVIFWVLPLHISILLYLFVILYQSLSLYHSISILLYVYIYVCVTYTYVYIYVYLYIYLYLEVDSYTLYINQLCSCWLFHFHTARLLWRSGFALRHQHRRKPSRHRSRWGLFFFCGDIHWKLGEIMKINPIDLWDLHEFSWVYHWNKYWLSLVILMGYAIKLWRIIAQSTAGMIPGWTM